MRNLAVAIITLLAIGLAGFAQSNREVNEISLDNNDLMEFLANRVLDYETPDRVDLNRYSKLLEKELGSSERRTWFVVELACAVSERSEGTVCLRRTWYNSYRLEYERRRPSDRYRSHNRNHYYVTPRGSAGYRQPEPTPLRPGSVRLVVYSEEKGERYLNLNSAKPFLHWE